MYVEVQLKGRPKLIDKVTKHNQRNITRLSRGETEAFTKEPSPKPLHPIITRYFCNKGFLLRVGQFTRAKHEAQHNRGHVSSSRNT